MIPVRAFVLAVNDAYEAKVINSRQLAHIVMGVTSSAPSSIAIGASNSANDSVASATRPGV